MQASDIPARFPIPFANNAGAGYIRPIPQTHQAATGSDAPASLYDGFPPETFLPEGSGGVPPNGADFNGILFQLSAWARWIAAGGPSVYNSTFATAIGGYPKGARLPSTTPGIVWQSTADNNSTDPDGGSPANWVAITPTRQFKDGIVSATLSAGPVYTVTFATPFPTECTSVGILGINASVGATRDTWPQLVSLSKNDFSYVIQNSRDAGSITLDGISWQAWGR